MPRWMNYPYFEKSEWLNEFMGVLWTYVVRDVNKMVTSGCKDKLEKLFGTIFKDVYVNLGNWLSASAFFFFCFSFFY